MLLPIELFHVCVRDPHRHLGHPTGPAGADEATSRDVPARASRSASGSRAARGQPRASAARRGQGVASRGGSGVWVLATGSGGASRAGSASNLQRRSRPAGI
jgi:hypothetical protein